MWTLYCRACQRAGTEAEAEALSAAAPYLDCPGGRAARAPVIQQVHWRRIWMVQPHAQARKAPCVPK